MLVHAEANSALRKVQKY